MPLPNIIVAVEAAVHPAAAEFLQGCLLPDRTASLQTQPSRTQINTDALCNICSVIFQICCLLVTMCTQTHTQISSEVLHTLQELPILLVLQLTILTCMCALWLVCYSIERLCLTH